MSPPRILAVVLFAVCCAAIHAQDCAPPNIIPNPRTNNIFSPEQEMVLGDLTYEELAGEIHIVRDPQLVAYVNRIGEKLIKHLPPTGLKFQFFIIDIPEANAFDVPGGYIFISRKLIGFTNNEDELAGVMGHELGHAIVRHAASDISALFKKILNVSQVGDRKDIAEKFHLLIERQRTKSVARKTEEDEEQLQADRVGLFALIAAGYDPTAFAGFFGRLVEAKGKTGNWFTDIFGKAKPEEKRLGDMIKVTDKLPQQCRDQHRANATQEFLSWQADVVAYHEIAATENLTGLLWKKELSPKLRSDVWRFAFSADGKYFLAQDDFAITVVQRTPLATVFQIPAPDADEASFTPDGRFVVFGTENLRFEKWSVAEKKPAEVRELVVRHDCWEHKYSPDGNYLVCFATDLNLSIIDTHTGSMVWEKKDFYQLDLFEFLSWIAAEAVEDDSHLERFFHIRFSPDSHFVLISRTNRFRFAVTFNGLRTGESDNATLGLDLSAMKPLNIGGELKNMVKGPFVFLDSTTILATSPNVEDAGTFSFPVGKRLAKFQLGGDELENTASPNYVVVKPLANAKLGLFDISKRTIVGAWNKADTSVWNNLILFEAASGKVTVAEMRDAADKKVEVSNLMGAVDLPVSAIGKLYASDVSDNLKWLTVSSKSRGAVWDLSSGERKMYVRGFRGAVVAENGIGIGDFPKLDPVNHSLVSLRAPDNDAQVLAELPEKGVKQYGRFLLVRQSLKAPKGDKDKPLKRRPFDPDSEDSSLARDVRFELRDIINNKSVWTREFPKEAPQFFFDQFSGRLILYWTLGSDVGKARLKEDAALGARSRELGNKDDDYLVEIVDAFAGKSVGALLLETGKGSFDIEAGFSEGNWLILHDSNNRILAYTISDGILRQRFFGAAAVVNPSRNLIAVENYPGELKLYDLDTGDARGQLNLGKRSAFLRFTLDGRQLFVLTGEQTAYAFSVDKLMTQTAVQ